MMGPIKDELGLEQGGKFSSEFYKIYNAEQLTVPQETDLGTFIGDVHIASIGQADDTVLVSNDLYKLKFLLHLTLRYCTKFNVELSATKTKLQMFTPNNMPTPVANLLSNSAQLMIDGSPIKFVNTAEHVGIIRSTDGNLPHLLNRFTSHNRALHSVLSVGLARAHRGNPAASFRVEKLYGLPVLLSGTASLNLKKSEENAISYHYKLKLQQLQKLHDKTPEPVVHFLAGSLPAEAILHIKKLSLFNMITRLPENILNRIARYILTTAKDNDKSWFSSISELCLKYNLPHPLLLLDNPLPKEKAKSLIKMKIQDFWQSHFRKASAPLPSLKYFRPEYMSLQKPHPIWTTCGNNSYEVAKAVIQAKFLSGRYRSESLTTHFSAGSSPNCSICPEKLIGSIEHILTICSSLLPVRSQHLKHLTESRNLSNFTKEIIQNYFKKPIDMTTQMLLDPSTLPEVIFAVQNGETNVLNEIFRFTRSWCHAMHRCRLQQLKDNLH